MRESVMNLKDLAYNAGYNISMNPERFGNELLNEVVGVRNSTTAAMRRRTTQNARRVNALTNGAKRW